MTCITHEGAAALHRSEPAFDWLVALVDHGTQARADCAVEALSVYERDSKLIERVRTALTKRSQARS